MRRLERVTVIVSLLCFLLSSILFLESWFISTRSHHGSKLETIASVFVPTVCLLIINRRSFAYIILSLYILAIIPVSLQAWDRYVGPVGHENVTAQSVLIVVSYCLFAGYFLFNLLIALIETIARKTE